MASALAAVSPGGGWKRSWPEQFKGGLSKFVRVLRLPPGKLAWHVSLIQLPDSAECMSLKKCRKVANLVIHAENTFHRAAADCGYKFIVLFTKVQHCKVNFSV